MSGRRLKRPLDLFQIDHTWMDVIVADDVDRKPLGRPWLTLVIDVATRMVAGYYISFDRPSSSSVALALSRAVLPKDRLLERFTVAAEWPVCGLPAAVHLDNAEEFHARALERGCEEHGIRLEFRPSLRPHYGGHVERLIGTLMKATHTLPGTTFSSSQEKGEYDSEKRAVVALGELETWLLLQITCIYHLQFHRGLGDTPLQAWKRNWDQAHARQPRDPDRLYVDFLPFERRKIRRDGIQLLHIHYWDNALSVLAGRCEDRVVVRYDPQDLSRIFIKEDGADGYAVTSHSSQGQTADRVLIHVDTELGAKDLLNNRMAYVAVSRGAYDAQLFTCDRENLGTALGRDVSHQSAHVTEKTPEHSVAPQREIPPKEEHSFGLGLGL